MALYRFIDAGFLFDKHHVLIENKMSDNWKYSTRLYSPRSSVDLKYDFRLLHPVHKEILLQTLDLCLKNGIRAYQDKTIKYAVVLYYVE